VEELEEVTGTVAGTTAVLGGKEEGRVNAAGASAAAGLSEGTAAEAAGVSEDTAGEGPADLPAVGQNRTYDIYPIPIAPLTATMDR
jgi:hypothetical protein